MTLPGMGSLDEPDAPPRVTKTIWDFHGVETSSRHVPHVSFHGRPHPGVIGTAPSAEVLAQWTKRESELAQRLEAQGGGREAGVSLPKSRGAYVGQDLDPELREKIYREGARTSPGREHGGNIDIASLVRGSKVYLVSLSGVCQSPTRLSLTPDSPYTSPAPSCRLATCTFPRATANPPPRSKCPGSSPSASRSSLKASPASASVHPCTSPPPLNPSTRAVSSSPDCPLYPTAPRLTAADWRRTATPRWGR